MHNLQKNQPESANGTLEINSDFEGASLAPPSFQLFAGDNPADNLPAGDPPPVQRQVTRRSNNENTMSGIKEGEFTDKSVETFLQLLDQKVQEAYNYVLKVPALDALADIDGHTSKWAETTFPALCGTPLNCTSTDFGYVIESITCLKLPLSFGDMTVELQGIRGSTRPDIILSKKGVDIAWLDITAHNSAGHIDKKIGWYDQRNCKFAGEVSYPSLEPGVVGVMKANAKNKTGDAGGDASELKAQLLEQKKLAAIRKDYWYQLGEQLAKNAKPLLGKPKEAYSVGSAFVSRCIPTGDEFVKLIGRNDIKTINRKKAEELFRDECNYDFQKFSSEMASELADFWGLLNQMPNILKAMFLNPPTYGFFGTGTTAVGQSWLQINDPQTPQSVTDKKESIVKMSDSDLMMDDIEMGTPEPALKIHDYD